MSDHVDVQIVSGVATVMLNRPEVRNAMDDGTLKELAEKFNGFSVLPGLRAVIVRGAGKDFSAGADIAWMRRAGRATPAQNRKDAALLFHMCRAIDECPVPVIARLHGAVFGGGLGVAAACDVVLAEAGARMCFSECRLGILPAVVSSWVLPKIGESNARRLYLTGEVFGMELAQRIGLVHEVVPEAELDARVAAAVEGVFRGGPQALRAAKKLIRDFRPLSKEGRIRYSIDKLVRARASQEGQEGMAAFLEKRPAAWTLK